MHMKTALLTFAIGLCLFGAPQAQAFVV